MQKTKHYPCVLTMAGSDSSGGAGIQADIKTIAATGCYAASIITAVTAQNTQGVQHAYAVPAQVVSQQIESVFSDLNVSAIKIGMLFNKSIIKAVGTLLERLNPKNIVLDPVMISKSGYALLKSTTIQYLKGLFSIGTLITPNIYEAERLIGATITTLPAMKLAATTLGKQYKTNILIKGGHLKTTETSYDVLYCYPETSCHWYKSTRIHTQNTHGTGCTLSSAIASYLAQHYKLPEAIRMAKQYLTHAIQSGSLLNIGHGAGPVDHFYFQK